MKNVPADRLPRPRYGLIADDTGSIRRLVGHVLRQHGMQVMEAFDGRDAWDKVCHILPDVIVTDLEMPRWSGVELLRQLRGATDPLLRRVPVIVISTLHGNDLKASVHRFEDTYFLGKPISVRTLSIMLRLIETTQDLRIRQSVKRPSNP